MMGIRFDKIASKLYNKKYEILIWQMTAVKKTAMLLASIQKINIDGYQFDGWHEKHLTVKLNSLSNFQP